MAYINKETVLEKVKKLANDLSSTCFAPPLMIREIENTPEADVVKVKHGEWIKATPYSQEYCNQCGLTPKTIFGWLPLYCPHCGAKMNKKEGKKI